MSHDHDYHDHAHQHAPETHDASSQALAEALRSSFAIVKIVMVLLVLAFFASGFFQVGPQEKAVILRFGKPVGEGQTALLNAGLHWSFPYPIDDVVKIPITEVQHVKSTTGWWFTTPEAELTGEDLNAGGPLNPAVDGYVFTADKNIVHVRATLSYKIDDPIRAVFGFSGDTNTAFNLAGVSNAVQAALDNALLYTAARFNVDDILTRDQQGFKDAVLQRVSDLTDQERLGISIYPGQCEVESKAPRQLQSVFDQVTTARENRIKAIQDAQSYTNKVLNEAVSTADAMTNEAATASANYVKYAQADAKQFSDLLPRYQANPELFVQFYLTKTISQVLTNTEKWVEPTSDNGKSTELRLELNREPPEPKAAGN
jgi:membrane protease subunit HflK